MVVFSVTIVLISIALVVFLRRKTDPRPLWDAAFEEKLAAERQRNTQQPNDRQAQTQTTPAGLVDPDDQTEGKEPETHLIQ